MLHFIPSATGNHYYTASSKYHSPWKHWTKRHQTFIFQTPDICHICNIYIVHIPQIFSHGFPQGKNPWPRICLWISKALLPVPAGRLMGPCHRTGRSVAPHVAHDAARAPVGGGCVGVEWNLIWRFEYLWIIYIYIHINDIDIYLISTDSVFYFGKTKNTIVAVPTLISTLHSWYLWRNAWRWAEGLSSHSVETAWPDLHLKVDGWTAYDGCVKIPVSNRS